MFITAAPFVLQMGPQPGSIHHGQQKGGGGVIFNSENPCHELGRAEGEGENC